MDLLRELKEMEREAGRGTVVPHVPNGPRPLDMDILMYDDIVLTDNSDPNMSLQIPHPRMHERRFVLQPVADLVTSDHIHPTLGRSIHDLLRDLPGDFDVTRVFPARHDVMWSFNKSTPKIFGVLNVTPDSFSDGGRLMSNDGKSIDTDLTVARAEKMFKEGAHVIDIGAESTRPHADKISSQIQIDRAVPTIERIRKELGEALLLSIDTTSSDVARAAIEAGVNMVNDVSGGLADSNMTRTVAKLNVPYILMHRRGDTSTMTLETSKTYGNVVHDVAKELNVCANDAQSCGIPRWNLLLDPGVGFSKTPEQSIHLLQNLSHLASSYPLLVGASRKRFLAHAVGRPDCSSPEDRDVASAALSAVLTSSSSSSSIAGFRVHNVGMTSDAIAIAKSIVGD